MEITTILPLLQLILTAANILVIGYGFFKFLNKPHDSLEERVTAHDVEIREIKDSLRSGNDKFRAQEKTNATFKSVMLSFVNFEIAYCLHTEYPHTEELMDAKRELEHYLTGNDHEKKNRD